MKTNLGRYRCDCTEWETRSPPSACPRCGLRLQRMGKHALWNQSWYFHEVQATT